jgi:hypothetical protein
MTAPTDCRGADQFQPVHRAGYGDRLEFLMQWLALHPDATLQSGEGGVLWQEIVRLREMRDRVLALCERADFWHDNVDGRSSSSYIATALVMDTLEGDA